MSPTTSSILALGVLVNTTMLTAADSPPELVASIEGISEYRLENGLQVLLYPDETKPTVTVNLTVFVGSRHEGYGEAGMAHLLEHMAFKGTPTNAEIPKALQARGADFNGTTWYDRTNYFETLPATEENLEFAIRLEADRLVNSHIRGEDLKSEMSVVRNEFESGENNPRTVLFQKMVSAAFQWHNYGQSTIGNRADIERVPVENLKRFYQKYYQPDNAVLVIAGKFDTETALKIVADSFGKIQRPERELEKTYTEEPAQDGERLVHLRRVGNVSVVGAVYHVPAGAHPDYVPLDALTNILTSPGSGRLYKALVESKKSASVSASAFSLHDPGIMLIMSEVASGNEPQVVLDTMFDVLEKLKEEGVTEAEVERARQQLIKQIDLSSHDTTQSAIELSEWASMGDWRLKFLYRDRVDTFSVEDVNRVAREYLKQNNRTVGIYIPVDKADRIEIPATPSLAEMIGEYKGRETAASGEVFDVSPENIEARTRRVELNSGVEAALLPKKTRGETVNLRLTLRYGDVESLAGMKSVAEVLPSLMTRGTKNLSREQLQDELDKQFAQLNASGNPGEATFVIETKKKNLPAVLDVLKQILREPALSDSELEIIRQAQLAGLQKQLTDPVRLASRTVSRSINFYKKDDPRYVPSLEEEIEEIRALTTADMQKLYSEFFNGAHGQLTIIGDFDVDPTVEQIESMLADWTSDKPFERISRNADRDIERSFTELTIPDKANAAYFAGTVFPLSDADEDYPGLVISNFILGDSALSSRLGDRVRQREGLSYGVASALQVSSLDQRAIFYMYAIYNPDNVEKLRQVILEELNKLIDEGVTEEELASAKKGYLEAKSVERSSDSDLARTLESTLLADRTMKFYADVEQRVRELTTADVAEAFRRHIDPENLVIVVAGDFRKAKTTVGTEKVPAEKKAEKK
ncbi:MAG: pitrilysin family protein [Planctomycetaceae bacterium]